MTCWAGTGHCFLREECCVFKPVLYHTRFALNCTPFFGHRLLTLLAGSCGEYTQHGKASGFMRLCNITETASGWSRKVESLRPCVIATVLILHL